MPKLPEELRSRGSAESLVNGHTKIKMVSNGRERPGSVDRLGICLFDLDRIPPDIRVIMGLAHLVDRTRIVRVVKDRPDEMAVVFICDLLAAACLCDTIRSWDKKAGDYPTRVYLCKSRMWERLPSKALLSLVDSNGKARLNPKWFTIRVLPGDLIPPPMEIPNGER